MVSYKSGTTSGDKPQYNKTAREIFAREQSVFVMKDSVDKEEKFYVHKFHDLMECGGHYIYYEKNTEMQNYMIASRRKSG